MEFLNDYIVLIVTGICFCIGLIIRNLVPVEKLNKFIPLIMGILGVILNVWLNGWIFTPEILLGGLVSGLASTGVWESIKGVKKLISKEE